MHRTLREIGDLRRQFPESFMWGASMSSHQVEGATVNQWTKWEHETAARLAASAKERLGWMPAWDDISRQATNPLNYVSGSGIEHRKKYLLDFKLAKSLHLNSLRSGIEWSRINPEQGTFDASAVDYYSVYFQKMKQSGLEPFVNLFHWSMPEWFTDIGGFEKRKNLVHWRDYVHTLVQNFDMSSVKHIIVINEANTYAMMGYMLGEFPPGQRNILKAIRVYRNLARAHKIAYKIIKAKYPDIQVGSSHLCNTVIGHGFFGHLSAYIQRWYLNWSWLRWARHHDFIGLNYYFTDHRQGITLLPRANPPSPVNDLGWYMNPGGIETVIRSIAKKYPKTPIIITENGLADMHDTSREWWITQTIEAMARCIKDGIPLVGYLHWTLLDNFEWQYGWFPKFGLIAVDRKTMMRKVKKSAKLWSAWLSG